MFTSPPGTPRAAQELDTFESSPSLAQLPSMNFAPPQVLSTQLSGQSDPGTSDMVRAAGNSHASGSLFTAQNLDLQAALPPFNPPGNPQYRVPHSPVSLNSSSSALSSSSSGGGQLPTLPSSFIVPMTDVVSTDTPQVMTGAKTRPSQPATDSKDGDEKLEVESIHQYIEVAKKELDELKQQYAVIENAHRAALETLNKSFEEKAKAQLDTQCAAFDRHINDAKAEHQVAVNARIQTMQDAHNQAVMELESKSESEKSDLQRRLEASEAENRRLQMELEASQAELVGARERLRVQPQAVDNASSAQLEPEDQPYASSSSSASSASSAAVSDEKESKLIVRKRPRSFISEGEPSSGQKRNNELRAILEAQAHINERTMPVRKRPRLSQESTPQKMNKELRAILEAQAHINKGTMPDKAMRFFGKSYKQGGLSNCESKQNILRKRK
jgi:hypothetical protein